MDWSEAVSLARSLMIQHGVGHLPLLQSRARTVAGATTFAVRKVGGVVVEANAKSIELSRPIVELNPREVVHDVVLHEIAHAKAGFEAGHGLAWRAAAIAVGARPERCCGEGVVAPTGKYTATCACAGRIHSVHRLPRVARVCCDCGKLLLWRFPATHRKRGSYDTAR